jgi:hypothetical protein
MTRWAAEVVAAADTAAAAFTVEAAVTVAAVVRVQAWVAADTGAAWRGERLRCRITVAVLDRPFNARAAVANRWGGFPRPARDRAADRSLDPAAEVVQAVGRLRGLAVDRFRDLVAVKLQVVRAVDKLQVAPAAVGHRAVISTTSSACPVAVAAAAAVSRDLVHGREGAWPAAARRVSSCETIPLPFPAAGPAPVAAVVLGSAT